jgi:uncharacterized protein YjbI with pentapeptide repeats
LKYNGTAWAPAADAGLTAEVDGIIGNEVTDATTGGGLVRAGSGTAAAPFTLGIATSGVTTDRMNALAVTTAKIADANVTTAKIANANVTVDKLADNSVNSAKIVDGSVAAADLATNAVTTVKITVANVTTAKIADANVTLAKIAANAVDSTKLGVGAVTSYKILDGTIENRDIKDATITGAKLANATVTAAKLDTYFRTAILTNIDSTMIKNLAVGLEDLAPNCVNSSKIQDGSVAAADLATNAVTTVKIADKNVTTDKIADGAVTVDKLAVNSVTSDKIVDGTIQSSDLSSMGAASGAVLTWLANRWGPVNVTRTWVHRFEGYQNDVTALVADAECLSTAFCNTIGTTVIAVCNDNKQILLRAIIGGTLPSPLDIRCTKIIYAESGGTLISSK